VSLDDNFVNNLELSSFLHEIIKTDMRRRRCGNLKMCT
jgi:hypothetical protein